MNEYLLMLIICLQISLAFNLQAKVGTFQNPRRANIIGLGKEAFF